MSFSVDNEDRFWKEPKQQGWYRFPTPLRYVLLLLLLIALVVGIWYLLPSSPPLNKAEIPLLKADETPFKIKAEDQGIPGVNHQDKLVYGRIRNDENRPSVEHILPLPEAPLAHANQSTVQMVDQYVPEDLDIEKETEKPSLPIAAASSSITSIEALLEEITPDQDLASVDPEASVKNPPALKKEKVLIQLGSLKSHTSATEEWERLSKKHNAILGGFDPLIQKVDLGSDQGIYYRLRAGGFENIAAAQAACSTLKEEKTDCRVVQ